MPNGRVLGFAPSRNSCEPEAVLPASALRTGAAVLPVFIALAAGCGSSGAGSSPGADAALSEVGVGTLDARAPGDAAADSAARDGGAEAATKGDGGGADAGPGDATSAADAADAGPAGPPGVAMFVASGYQNRRIVSLDGVTWINDATDAPNSLDDIGTGLTIGLGTIVVAGHTGIYTSRDGKAWTKLPAPIPQAWPGLGGAAAAFGQGTFVIVNDSTSWTSADAVTFTPHTPDGGTQSATHWNGMAYGNGHFVAVGDSNGPGDRKASEDGVTWHDYVQDATPWQGVAFGGGVFVAVGSNGRRAWTTDGVTFNDVTDASLGNLGGVAYGNGTFLVDGAQGSATSTDGKTWTKGPSFNASELTYGGGLFLTTTWMSNILTSPDGTTWKTAFSGQSGSAAIVRTAWGVVGGS
jgi:hypothetical protein